MRSSFHIYFFSLLLAAITGQQVLAQEGRDTMVRYFNEAFNALPDEREAVYTGLCVRNGRRWFVTLYDAAGTVRMRGSYRDRALHIGDGPFIYFDRDGNKAVTGRIVKGANEGWWVSWYPQGTVRDSTFFKDRFATGRYARYYPGGQLQVVGTLEWNYPSGLWTTYHENGRVNSITEYVGYRIENAQYFDKDGEPLPARYTSEGVRHDSVIYLDRYFDRVRTIQEADYFGDYRKLGPNDYHVNAYNFQGNRLASIHYSDRSMKNKNGPFIAYDSAGNTMITANFVQNEVTGPYRRYHANGQLRDSGDFHKLKQTGTWTSWYEDGSVREKGEYRDGARTGVWQYYDNHLNTRARGFFRDGVQLGDWTIYDENGKFITTTNFNELKQFHGPEEFLYYNFSGPNWGIYWHNWRTYFSFDY